MRRIELQEYERWTGTLDASAVDELEALAGSRLDVTRLSGGRVEIVATSHVGVLVTAAITVRIRPKVELDNLFYMLGIGGTAWKVERANAPYRPDEDDVYTALVRLFAREVDRLTGRGLLRGYVTYEERLPAIRGRVDLMSAMRRPWERTPVSCRFDEFVPDIWVNCALLAGLGAARRAGALPATVRAELHLLMQRFEGVSRTPVSAAEIERWGPSRSDRHYQVALRLAAILLDRLSLADRDGGALAASFTIEMNQLYEEFLGRELRDRMPSHLALAEQYSTTLDVGGKLGIRPDFVIHPTGRKHDPIYVADAKYKLTESLGVIGDHYQLMSYATVFGLEEGALIYCQRPDGDVEPDDSAPVRTVTVRGSGIEHHVYRLDVSGTRQQIETRLDALATWLLGRIRAREELAIAVASGIEV